MKRRISARALEEAAFGHPDPETAAAIEADPELRAARDGLRAERDAFLAARPPAPFIDGVIAASDRRRRRTGFMAGAGVLAAAAALALIIGRPTEPDIAFKGEGPLLRVHRARGGLATPYEGRLEPGDVLRFSVSTEAPLEVALFDYDGRGPPSRWAGPHRLKTPTEALPGSIQLDQSTSDEVLILVHCAESPDWSELEAWLSEQLEDVEVGAAQARLRDASPPGACRLDMRMLEKVGD